MKKSKLWQSFDRKWEKTILIFGIILAFLALIPIIFLVIYAFSDSNAIERVELGSFPDNIVYYVNEADYVDLTGATLIMEIRDGRIFEDQIYDNAIIRYREITDNIDFSTPGVYEVTIRWTLNGDLIGRIPIQVIEREPEQ